jgi:hypothetical protein
MIGWLMLGAAVVAMYRIADVEGRSGIGWAGLTFALCLLSALFVPLPLINIALGFLIAFGIMFAMKIKDGPR